MDKLKDAWSEVLPRFQPSCGIESTSLETHARKVTVSPEVDISDPQELPQIGHGDNGVEHKTDKVRISHVRYAVDGPWALRCRIRSTRQRKGQRPCGAYMMVHLWYAPTR